MKKFKVLALMLVLVLSMQGVACAAPADTVSNDTVQTTAVQPRGRYLLGGGCSIAPGAEYVTVGGHTDAYEDADELIIQLTILKEISPGCFVAIWTDSVTGYDDFEVGFPSTRVYVDPGYNYMVEAIHTVKHNGVTESNDSEAGPVYAYYN